MSPLLEGYGGTEVQFSSFYWILSTGVGLGFRGVNIMFNVRTLNFHISPGKPQEIDFHRAAKPTPSRAAFPGSAFPMKLHNGSLSFPGVQAYTG